MAWQFPPRLQPQHPLRPAGCAGRRFNPVGRVFGSVSLQVARDQVRSTKRSAVRLQRAALDEGHPLPGRAAVAPSPDLWLVTVLQRLVGICCVAGRRRSGAEVEGVGFAGDDHDRRTSHSLSAARPLEQGSHDRPEASVEAEGRLDNSCSPAAGGPQARSCDVQSGHRQQAQGLRSRHSTCCGLGKLQAPLSTSARGRKRRMV